MQVASLKNAWVLIPLVPKRKVPAYLMLAVVRVGCRKQMDRMQEGLFEAFWSTSADRRPLEQLAVTPSSSRCLPFCKKLTCLAWHDHNTRQQRYVLQLTA